MAVQHLYPMPPYKPRGLENMPDLQEELSGAVTWFLESLYRQEEDAWNDNVKTVFKGWKEGKGSFAKEAGWHIEAICDAVRRAMEEVP